MKNNANQSKTYRIYLKHYREWIDVPEEVYSDNARYCGAVRKRAQYHGQCSCKKYQFWLCDGACEACEFRCTGDQLSLDYEYEGDRGSTCTLESFISDEGDLLEDIIADKLLLDQLTDRLRELDPDADIILDLLEDKKSDRAIAQALGRPQRTFARQMQRYRNELRKIRGF